MYQWSPVLPPELDELAPLELEELPPELEELPPELEEVLPEPEELPLELDEPPHDPVTTRSHPCPHVSEDAHPNCGLWQANPSPPSGYLHAYKYQLARQHDPPPELELEALTPELDAPPPSAEPSGLSMDMNAPLQPTVGDKTTPAAASAQEESERNVRAMTVSSLRCGSECRTTASSVKDSVRRGTVR